MITKQNLLENGFVETFDLSKGVILLKDGVIISGYSTADTPDNGVRFVEHRDFEDFTLSDRYDFDDYWLELLQSSIIIEPETETAIYLNITDEQKRILENSNFTLKEYK